MTNKNRRYIIKKKANEENGMELTKKLKMAMLEMDVNQVELAKRIGSNQPNLSAKMRAENYRVSEYENLVKALGCELEINIILPNGKRF